MFARHCLRKSLRLPAPPPGPGSLHLLCKSRLVLACTTSQSVGGMPAVISAGQGCKLKALPPRPPDTCSTCG